MAHAKNKVIAGDYEGMTVTAMLGNIHIGPHMFGSYNIENCELVTDEIQKSAASGVARGIIGGALLGPVGMVVGATTAKSKGIYTVAVQFNDGKKSLLEVDDKIYKSLVKISF